MYLLYLYIFLLYRGADKSLARPTSQYILFDGENVSFDASLVIYINSTNIPQIMIITRIYETQKSSVAVACFLPGRAKDLSAPLFISYDWLRSQTRDNYLSNFYLFTNSDLRRCRNWRPADDLWQRNTSPFKYNCVIRYILMNSYSAVRKAVLPPTERAT
jgi:hypothetical protein